MTDLGITQTLGRLHPAAAALANHPDVTVLPVGHPDVPAELARQIAKVANGAFAKGMPSVCNHDTDTGKIHVVLGDGDFAGHELIHAAQVLAPKDALQDSFDALVDEGQRITEAAYQEIHLKGADKNAYSDIHWCDKATAPKPKTVAGREIGPARPQTSDELMSTFDLHMLVHHKEGTLEVARTTLPEHLDDANLRRASNAAVFAFFMHHHGMRDASSDVAREVVAYRHDADLDGVEPLLAAAANAPSRDFGKPEIDWAPNPEPMHSHPWNKSGEKYRLRVSITDDPRTITRDGENVRVLKGVEIGGREGTVRIAYRPAITIDDPLPISKNMDVELRGSWRKNTWTDRGGQARANWEFKADTAVLYSREADQALAPLPKTDRGIPVVLTPEQLDATARAGVQTDKRSQHRANYRELDLAKIIRHPQAKRLAEITVAGAAAYAQIVHNNRAKNAHLR